jgi:hypothetical protein
MPNHIEKPITLSDTSFTAGSRIDFRGSRISNFPIEETMIPSALSKVGVA